MHRLRSVRLLARLVLAWFALSLGVAVASPWVQPQSFDLICTGTGVMKVLVTTADGAQEVSAHTLDCPLCANLGSPPPPSVADAPPVQPLAHALRPLVAAHIAWATAAPLPARGPPSSS